MTKIEYHKNCYILVAIILNALARLDKIFVANSFNILIAM